MRILVVDDETVVRRSMVRMLQAHTFEVLESRSGEDALALMARESVDMLLIDWVLGGMSGLDLVRSLRRTGNSIPVIVVTGRHDRDACCYAFDAGADDFVTKPLGRALISRVRHLLRRHRDVRSPPAPLVLGPMSVDACARTVSIRVNGSDGWRRLNLTRTELDVVLVLAERIGFAVSRDALLERAWGKDVAVSCHVVEAIVCKIRKKLGPARGLLCTVKGGYRLGPAGRGGGQKPLAVSASGDSRGYADGAGP